MSHNRTVFDGEAKLAPQTYPIVETPKGPRVHKYGLYWPLQNDVALELNAFRLGVKKEDGGLGKLRHLFEAKHLIWPHTKETLHPWTVQRYRACCEGHKIITLAGGAGTSKSYDMAYYALLWWWANPTERTVLMASTTIGALQKRIWGYVVDGIREAVCEMPAIQRSNPTPMVLFNRNDIRHGIHGIALREGEAERTLREVIGIHPRDALLVVIDEATDVTPAITDAIVNWDKGGVNFQMICIGNSKSRLDPHGRLSKPKRGWKSVDPDIDTEWETGMGLCLYFDCYKSPAIHTSYGHKLPFLINEEQIKKDEERLGKDDPKFWRFTRGFWPPDDMSNTVLSVTAIEKYKADEKAAWAGTWKVKIAALDPAFSSEGDECILRFGEMGPFENGRIGIDFGGEQNVISVQLDTRSKEPVNYQIVRIARQKCEELGIEPEFFGLDTWGFGMGAGDICEVEWSPYIRRINSVGAPTERFVDSEMSDTAKDVYDRRVTEMWFSMRSFVLSGQIRGLDEITIEELCSRMYAWKGRKMSVETKKDYKKRMGKEESPTGSPDRADAAVLLLEVARLNGLDIGERQVALEDKWDWESRWEKEKGYKGIHEEEREDMWSVDAILDSAMFTDEP